METAPDRPPVDQLLSAAQGFEQDGNWEEAGMSYALAYEGSHDPQHAERALSAVRILVEEGGPRRSAARAIVLKLQSAGYDNQEVQSYVALLDA